MNTYFFSLGTNHSLCKAEIINFLCFEGIKFEILEASKEILIIQTSAALNANELINQLGSAAKFGEVFISLPLGDLLQEAKKLISQKEFIDFFLNSKNKHVLFGLSVYGAGVRFKDLNTVFYLAPKVIGEIKKSLLSLGLKSATIPLKERTLSTVSVDKNKLISEGFEICLLAAKENVYFAKTKAVQDYESYSLRDFGRPNRDRFSGMTPPKIAKMMINLCSQNKDAVLLDPFCGSGTFLEEEMLLGYKNIIGADQNQTAIENTKSNLNWLINTFHLDKNAFSLTLKVSSIEKLNSCVAAESVDAIITEPFLGSPKMSTFSLEQVKKEVETLERIYLAAFAVFKKIMKKGGVLSIIFPSIYSHRQTFTLKISGEIEKMGFKQKNFLPEIITAEEKHLLNLEITDRNSIVYFRPGQTVSREIFLFQKN